MCLGSNTTRSNSHVLCEYHRPYLQHPSCAIKSALNWWVVPRTSELFSLRSSPSGKQRQNDNANRSLNRCTLGNPAASAIKSYSQPESRFSQRETRRLPPCVNVTSTQPSLLRATPSRADIEGRRPEIHLAGNRGTEDRFAHRWQMRKNTLFTLSTSHGPAFTFKRGVTFLGECWKEGSEKKVAWSDSDKKTNIFSWTSVVETYSICWTRCTDTFSSLQAAV